MLKLPDKTLHTKFHQKKDSPKGLNDLRKVLLFTKPVPAKIVKLVFHLKRAVLYGFLSLSVVSSLCPQQKLGYRQYSAEWLPV
ncbi:hypothetical protein D3C76_1639690 [compost metagenome]